MASTISELSPLELYGPPIEFKLSKTKQIWRYFLKEVDNLIDIFQVVVFDYYARFNMGVAKCLFVNIPSFLWNCVRKLRNRGFDRTDRKALEELWSKKKDEDELDIGEVRWFMKKYGSNWEPIKGYDSILLEITFRTKEMNQEGKDEFFQEMSQLYNTKIDNLQNPIVLKGLYKPDDSLQYLEPLYWQDTFDRISIKRCTRFYSNLTPDLDEKVRKDLIKIGYLEANFEEDRPDFDHLVFIIHGHLRNPIVIREFASKIQNLMETLPAGTQGYRPMIIPVEWRSELDLPESYTDLISSTGSLLSMKQNIHLKLTDVMYYMSPGFQNKIANRVTTLLNSSYEKFINNHPIFLEKQGRVSLIGHSLGAVIVHDVISGYRATQLADLLQRKGDGRTLKFKVQNAFLIGSPLSLFSSAREIDLQETLKKQSCRFYNILHPLDPVAFRIEPCVHPEYARITPELVYPCYQNHAKEFYGHIPQEYIYRVVQNK